MERKNVYTIAEYTTDTSALKTISGEATKIRKIGQVYDGMAVNVANGAATPRLQYPDAIQKIIDAFNVAQQADPRLSQQIGGIYIITAHKDGVTIPIYVGKDKLHGGFYVDKHGRTRKVGDDACRIATHFDETKKDMLVADGRGHELPFDTQVAYGLVCREEEFDVYHFAVPDKQVEYEQAVYDLFKASDFVTLNQERPQAMPKNNVKGHVYLRFETLAGNKKAVYVGSAIDVKKRWKSRARLPQVCELYASKLIQEGWKIHCEYVAVGDNADMPDLETKLIAALCEVSPNHVANDMSRPAGFKYNQKEMDPLLFDVITRKKTGNNTPIFHTITPADVNALTLDELLNLCKPQ